MNVASRYLENGSNVNRLLKYNGNWSVRHGFKKKSEKNSLRTKLLLSLRDMLGTTWVYFPDSGSSHGVSFLRILWRPWGDLILGDGIFWVSLLKGVDWRIRTRYLFALKTSGLCPVTNSSQIPFVTNACTGPRARRERWCRRWTGRPAAGWPPRGRRGRTRWVGAGAEGSSFLWEKLVAVKNENNTTERSPGY